MDKILFSIVFAYYIYIFMLIFLMLKWRKKAFTSGSVDKQYFKDYKGDVDSHLVVVQNHINNQFQVPIFFFITCVVAKLFNAVTIVTVVLALFFFATRIWHSFIHLGRNNPLKRAKAYGLGMLILVAMWVYILIIGQ